jgi:uncharacterized membrane protein YkoI
VELHQQKSNPQPDPKPNPNHPNHPTPTPTPTPSPSPNHPNPKHQPRQQVTLLTQDQAKAIALTQYKGVVKDIKLTKENGKDVYIIVIHGQDGKDHTVKVDAITGAIVNNFTQDQAKYKFTQDQAKDVAMKQYKGTVKDIHLNKENGKDVYVAVINGQDGKDHTVKVDPSTGSLVRLTQDQVKVIALKQYKGTVKNVQLNNENGRDVYKISIHDQNGKDHDVKIDANTGEIY